MASGAESKEDLAGLRREAEDLKEEIAKIRAAKDTTPDEWRTIGKSDGQTKFSIQVRRHLRGHFQKVYAMHWSGDNRRIASVSQDAKLFVWDAFKEVKEHAVPVKNAWVMTLGFEQEKQRLVASGGLDNVCTVWAYENPPDAQVHKKLEGHLGYLSCCRFRNGGAEVLTSSGDWSCRLFNVESQKILLRMKEHTADVMSVAFNPNDPNMFCSGSCDMTVRVWDLRSGKCTHVFADHDSDVNAVDFFPNGYCVGSGSDDSICRLFDLRAYGTLNRLWKPQLVVSVTSVAFSKSGRLMFAGYDADTCYAWDTVSTDGAYHELKGHSERVSCLGVNSSGEALCTGSWDKTLAVWS